MKGRSRDPGQGSTGQVTASQGTTEGTLPSTVAVLGAGVMGRQIAGLLASAGVEVDLLDLGTADDPAGM
ncbi:MAG: 3-hydroxyacyl-CoA dehydrogenase NAD-binding domain-containing protein, partial [Candidatus Latescibacterota bacterium]|nr:3-hydroxyacyl-CoA dehydrogenase NAD-binding domain-containing protein [Candidatus Latescibacterota bacterium]